MAYERQPNFKGGQNFRDRRPKLSKEERAKLVEERLKQQHLDALEEWKPKTKLGILVKTGKIKDKGFTKIISLAPEVL